MIRSRENLYKVPNIVESNPAIMDGTPVFRGEGRVKAVRRHPGNENSA